MKLNAQQLRKIEEERARGEMMAIKRHPIYFILEDIYDTYNIGGLFRLADALAVEKVYLVGETATPPNSRIKKASIGTYKVVNWHYCKSAEEAIRQLKGESTKIFPQVNSSLRSSNIHSRQNFISSPSKKISFIAVEQNEKAIPYTKANYQLPLALIFGNESYGVKPETLSLVDQIVEIPMYGINKSLNVIVAAAIVSYFIAEKFY